MPDDDEAYAIVLAWHCMALYRPPLARLQAGPRTCARDRAADGFMCGGGSGMVRGPGGSNLVDLVNLDLTLVKQWQLRLALASRIKFQATKQLIAHGALLIAAK